MILNADEDAIKQKVSHITDGSINSYNLSRGQFVKQLQKETNFCWSHGQKDKNLLIHYLSEVSGSMLFCILLVGVCLE